MQKNPALPTAGLRLNNLIEYALGRDGSFNEAQGGAAGLPEARLSTNGDRSVLKLSFALSEPLRSDVIYSIAAADSPAGPWSTLASSSGGGWTGSAAVIIGEISNGRRIYSFEQDISALNDQFFRLQISHR